MDQLLDFKSFIAVVEKGSLSAAARHLGRSLQSVSRSLATVERNLGVPLIRRTTRRSSPTDAGMALYRRLKSGLMEIEIGKEEASQRLNRVSGTLRITASSAFGSAFVAPAVATLLHHHPKVEVELDLSDRYLELTNSEFDLAVRIGAKPGSQVNARKLAELRSVLFASPRYFAQRGRPTRPDQLAKHDCIIRTGSREENKWQFLVGGKVKAVKVAGRFRTSSVAAAREAAVLGLGIASAPFWQIRSLVDQDLVELTLARFAPPASPIHAVWASKRELPISAQLFVDILARRLQAERL